MVTLRSVDKVFSICVCNLQPGCTYGMAIHCWWSPSEICNLVTCRMRTFLQHTWKRITWVRPCIFLVISHCLCKLFFSWIFRFSATSFCFVIINVHLPSILADYGASCWLLSKPPIFIRDTLLCSIHGLRSNLTSISFWITNCWSVFV